MTEAHGERFHLVRLAFDYAGYEIPALPPEAVTAFRQADRVVRVKRRRAEEEAALNPLTAAGFVTAASGLQGNEGGPVLSMSADTPEDTARLWDQFLESEIPALRAAGWEVVVDGSCHLGITAPDSWQLDVDDQEGGWLNWPLVSFPTKPN